MKLIGFILITISLFKLLIVYLISSQKSPIVIEDLENYKITAIYLVFLDMFIGALGGACLYYL